MNRPNPFAQGCPCQACITKRENKMEALNPQEEELMVQTMLLGEDESLRDDLLDKVRLVQERIEVCKKRIADLKEIVDK